MHRVLHVIALGPPLVAVLGNSPNGEDLGRALVGHHLVALVELPKGPDLVGLAGHLGVVAVVRVMLPEDLDVFVLVCELREVAHLVPADADVASLQTVTPVLGLRTGGDLDDADGASRVRPVIQEVAQLLG